jgi:hypothetical protein
VKSITLKQAEAALGEPASAWVARCYEIASRLVDRGVVEGVAIYGHWRGPVAKGSHFAGRNGAGFVRHGWVLLPDCRIFDPTRWVFENVRPYLYVGSADHYDEGGNIFRESQEPARPPKFNDDEEVYVFDQFILPDADAFKFIERLFDLYEREDCERPELSRNQIHWLAHRNPKSLKGNAKAIYAALTKLDLISLVPIDNQTMVEHGRDRPKETP